MCASLGIWFDKHYRNLFPQPKAPLRWRCSTSERGKESGYDFKSGYNSSNKDVNMHMSE